MAMAKRGVVILIVVGLSFNLIIFLYVLMSKQCDNVNSSNFMGMNFKNSTSNRFLRDQGKEPVDRPKEVEEKDNMDRTKLVEKPDGKMNNVGFLITATGGYTDYIVEQTKSFHKHVFVGRDNWDFKVFYFISGKPVTPVDKCVYVHQEKLAWPFDSMNRFHIYLRHMHLWKEMDYIVAMDVDLYWANDVTPEFLLADFLTVIHSVVTQKGQGRYERRPEGQAFLSEETSGQCWKTMGGFYGGKTDTFIDAITTMSEWVNIDGSKDPPMIPIWHDESYLNKFTCTVKKLEDPTVKYHNNKFLAMNKLPHQINDPQTKVAHPAKNAGEIRGRN